MKRSKLSKKSLSILLAGITLFQSGLVCSETHAENEVSKYYKTATAALGTLTGAGLITIIGLALKISNQSSDITEKQQRIRNLSAQIDELNETNRKLHSNNSGHVRDIEALKAKLEELGRLPNQEQRIAKLSKEIFELSVKLNEYEKQLHEYEKNTKKREQHWNNIDNIGEKLAEALRVGREALVPPPDLPPRP